MNRVPGVFQHTGAVGEVGEGEGLKSLSHPIEAKGLRGLYQTIGRAVDGLIAAIGPQQPGRIFEGYAGHGRAPLGGCQKTSPDYIGRNKRPDAVVDGYQTLRSFDTRQTILHRMKSRFSTDNQLIIKRKIVLLA